MLPEVSTEGRVRRLGCSSFKSQRLNYKGYLKVDLYKKGKRKTFSVHRLVAEAFISNPNNLPQVTHKNGLKVDNTLKNLELCNNSYNMKHSFKIGINPKKVGESNSSSKLKNEDVLEIRNLHKAGISMSKLSIRYYVSISTISSIIRKITWKHL